MLTASCYTDLLVAHLIWRSLTGNSVRWLLNYNDAIYMYIHVYGAPTQAALASFDLQSGQGRHVQYGKYGTWECIRVYGKCLHYRH